MRAERLCGYSGQKLHSLDIRHLFGAEPDDPLERRLNSVAAGGEPVIFRAALSKPNGLREPVEVNLAPFLDPEGPGGILCTLKEAYTGAAANLELMAASSPDVILSYDMQQSLLYANPALEQVTGYTAEELAADRLIGVQPEDRGRLAELWQRTFHGETVSEEEYRLRTKDGRLVWMAASWGPVRDAVGIQVGVRARERDMTTHHLADLALHDSVHALRSAEDHFHRLFDESPVPQWEEDFSEVKALVDAVAPSASGDWKAYFGQHLELVEECVKRVRVLHVNRAALQFYGASTQEELVSRFGSLFDAATCAMFADELAVFASGLASYETEITVRTLRGEPRLINLLVSIQPSSADDWSHVVVNFVDLTARKRTEEQFLQSQKMESLGRLAGGIAHDINNILTVVNGYCDLLLGRLPQDDPSRAWLTEIRKSGQQGTDLMQQLLAFSRRQPMQSRPTSLNGLVRETETLMRRLVGEDIGLVTMLDPAAGHVEADPALLQQLLLNLLANAREAMPNGGVLTIQTCNVWLDQDDREVPSAQSDRPFVVLRVSDTGAGMDERTCRHLFEPFYSPGKSGPGAGLALAAAFGIATQQGGHIDVASEPGKGSTFSVLLPRSREEAVQPPSPPAQGAEGKGVVLIAEDQREVRMLAAAILRRLGYEVLEAANASEALIIAGRHSGHIRLLLTDIVMPGMSGIELALKFAELRPETRVILMSGYMDRDLGGANLDPSVAFLPKPFTPDALAAAVRRVLGRSAAV